MNTTGVSHLNRLASVAQRLNGPILGNQDQPAKIFKVIDDPYNPNRQSTLIYSKSRSVKPSPKSKSKLEEELAAQRGIEAKLRKRIAMLENKLREKEEQITEMDTYAYTVAHGLKTPLSVVTFASEMLIPSEASGVPDPDAPELLTSIYNMGNKMASIIENLLTLTGISQAVIDTESLDMAQILWEVQERLATKIEQSDAQIVFATPLDQWPKALGNRPLAEEVWDNFISNAIKYGGNPPHIELGAKVLADGMVCFSIRDNGHGIPMTTQNRLFKAFNRLHVNLADGHGLGLAIVDRIIRRLGGSVAVQSSGVPGEGSTFSFTLPAG